MTKILMVKMTSMGDVLHVLPALEDIAERVTDVSIDWMVEDSFAEIPSWHPLVDRVIPVASRRWRQLSWANLKAFVAFVQELRREQYDYIIDAQGLMKSAIFSRFARLKRGRWQDRQQGGRRIGFAGNSIKEWPAAWLYSKRVTVARNEHAVDRIRQLIGGGLDARITSVKRSYKILEGVERAAKKMNQPMLINAVQAAASRNAHGDQATLGHIFLLHGTTWATKHLPEQLWYRIAEQVVAEHYTPVLAWGNEQELQRAQRIAEQVAGAVVLPKASLTALAQLLATAQGAIAVDTGLGHLAAALDIPCVSLYGATDPTLTGTYGYYQAHLQAEFACAPCLAKECTELRPGSTEPPCYATFGAATAWRALAQQIAARKRTLGV